MRTIVCHKCRHSWTFDNIIGRTEECPKCHWDAHVCLNCNHYDPMANRQCREPDVDYVKDKDESNFCDLFDARSTAGSGDSEADKAKSALDSLFGKPADAKPEPDPKASLEEQLKKYLASKN